MQEKKQKGNILTAVIFCLFLLTMGALFFLLPRQEYSPLEKRYLAPVPGGSLGSIANGAFGEEAENWAADHLPGRSFFVSLSAWADWLLNLQVTKEIYVGRSGRLYECPAAFSGKTIEQNMAVLNDFAETIGQNVDLILIPSAGAVMQEDVAGLSDPYEDGRIIAEAYTSASARVRPLDLQPVFSASGDPSALYYRTDHHWTSRGAYTAYAAYMDSKGRAFPSPEEYAVTKEGGFYGSAWSRACFWNIPPEELELWSSGGVYSVTFSEKEGEYDHLFFPERLEEPDKYPVWLDGNHPLVVIENHAEDAKGSLLVIRDSFCNCLGCFLADSYKTVTLVDLRYYRRPVSELCAQGQFDDVLFLYSVGNFMSDSNIGWLS